jgi:hypothetical protein
MSETFSKLHYAIRTFVGGTDARFVREVCCPKVIPEIACTDGERAGHRLFTDHQHARTVARSQ